MVYLQQDAFDEVDASMSRERQGESFRLLKAIIDNRYEFTDRDAARDFFTRLTSLYKNWNYAAENTNDYTRYRDEISALVEQQAGGEERRSAERAAE